MVFLKLLTLLLGIWCSLAQEEVPKPKFPDVFQSEMQGIFQEDRAEMDASLYYDRPNNRAVIAFTYQNDSTISIFNFNDSQLTYIKGAVCTVREITTESFFPYELDNKTGKKTIASPEEFFFFKESKLDRQEISIFPSYVYTAKIDIPRFGLLNCEVSHIFSKPELELPDCEGHSCKPTLVSISVKCPPVKDDEDQTEVFHIYNFFRFRSKIQDESVFQPPVGIHCDTVSQKPFPEFPKYFSFSYDLIEEQKDGTDSVGVFTYYKKVWYDTKLRLIRMDEFDKDGLLISSRIYDSYGQTAYTIVASIPTCEAGSLGQDIELSEMTRLPKILFAKKPDDKKDAVYIGTRNVHGLEHEVWTLSHVDGETEAKVVQEFYFTNNIQKGLNESNKNYLQLSHVDIYTYEKDDDSENYELSMLTYLSISNFRSRPKEWEAFDISSCFSGEQKKGFVLEVEGPPVVKNSFLYEEVLEKLYMKLIIRTNVSVIRISQLKGRFDGIYISEFTGWILNKIDHKGISNKEPDMNEAYNIIEKAASNKELSITVKKDDEIQTYKITAVTQKVTDKTASCISGGTMASVSIILLLMGITFGFVGYYTFVRKKKPTSDDKVELNPVI